MTDIVERLRGGYKFGDSDTVLEAADRIAELEQQIYSERKSHEGWQQQSLIDEAELGRELAAETKNKQEFERDWLACCDKLNDERRIHLELEETLVKKLEAAQAREKVLRDALESVRQYGSDTLSGRIDGPDDREWQRNGVLEMTRRAIVRAAAEIGKAK